MLAAFAAALAGACVCVRFEPDTLFACAEDGSCPAGLVCIAGVCDTCAGDCSNDGGNLDAGPFDAGTSPDSGEPVAPCDVGEAVDATQGVFVSSTSGNDLWDGSDSAPVKTLTRGIERARALGKQTVYLDEGNYNESVTITGPEPLVIRGGWKRGGAIWNRLCPGRASAQITGNPPVAITAISTGAGSALKTLTVRLSPTVDAGADLSGGSSIGVLVAGSSDFELFDVDIATQPAASGGPTTPRVDPGAVACAGWGDCSNGAAGIDQPQTRAAADAGSFSAAGFKPGDGVAGVGSGGNGENGDAGTAGDSATKCYGSCTCTSNNCNNNNDWGPRSAGNGKCGCGGKGGPPGSAGHGGGASVAFLAVNTTANVSWSRLAAGRGGDGSPGGDGTAGSPTPGTYGQGTTCTPDACVEVVSCNPSGACYPAGDAGYVPLVLVGGHAGGAGGRGGLGAPGGGGAGGPSHAIASVGTSTVSVIHSTCRLSADGGGFGAQGSPDGLGDRIAQY